MKPAYQKTKEEIFQDCRSSQSGLSSEEVEKRHQEYGYNELIEGQKKSVFVIFLEQFKDFLVLILIAAAAVSIVLNDIESACSHSGRYYYERHPWHSTANQSGTFSGQLEANLHAHGKSSAGRKKGGDFVPGSYGGRYRFPGSR